MKKVRNSFLLVITAFIWGVAFVAQRSGGAAVGPFSFNCIRSLIGGTVLLPVILILDKAGMTSRKPVTKKDKKVLLQGGVACGTVLFAASSMQQLGLYYGTSAGKAGFLTACYILIVPIISIFLGKKCGWNIWCGVGMTLAGLYLLCMTEKISLQFGDALVLICAVLFALHILVIDHFAPLVDGVRMSCIQFFTCGIWGLIPMFFVEMKHSLAGIAAWLPGLTTMDAWIAILYAGVMSCGIAYTLQIIGQEGLNPTIASMLMSLESVFSVIAGAWLLHEVMQPRELAGCVLIFAAIIFAQLPVKGRK